MKFAIYARRSEEKDTGESIPNQLKICKKYIQLKFGENSTIEEFFDDDYSGKNSKRPSFTRMMRLIKGGTYKYLVFWKLDRVSRNALEFLSLNRDMEKLGVNLISVTEGFDPSTTSGKLMMTILASVAEMERKNISLRVSTAMIENAKKGRWGGGKPPLGYKATKLIENGIQVTYLTFDDNIEIAKYIFNDFKLTGSFRATSRNLKDKYNIYKTPVDIKRILVNPIYVKSSENIKMFLEKQGFKIYGEMNGNGMLSYGKEDSTGEDGTRKKRKPNDCIISVGKHSGIIEDYDFIKIYELVNNAKIGKPATSENTFLNPLVYCSICKGRMRTKVMNRGENKYVYFTCYEKDTHNTKCINKSVKASELENDVLDKLEYIYLHKEEFKKNAFRKDTTPKVKLEKLEKQLEKNKLKIKRLIIKSAENEDLHDEYTEVIRDLKNESKNIEIDIEQCKNQTILDSMFEENQNTIINTLKNIKKAIKAAKDMETKRIIIRSVVKKITVNGINKTFDIELYNF